MAELPLFEAYPKLKSVLPRIELGQFPTPVQRLEELGRRLGVSDLYIKREDLTNAVFGGNKVRPLEFCLGKAKTENAEWILTIGPTGSNSVACSATHARANGMRCVAVLFPQPDADYVALNLGADVAADAQILLSLHEYLVPVTALRGMICRFLRDRRFPYYIPAGVSNATGCVGHVNSAFELKKQVDEGELPEPDYIFLALGTCGTAAGLTLGLKSLGMKTQVLPVRITERIVCNARITARLLNETARLLKKEAPSFPEIEVAASDIPVLHDYVGPGYALPTPECSNASNMIRETEGIELETSYTAKALAALVGERKGLELGGKCVLFWYTRPGRESIHTPDAAALPSRCRMHLQPPAEPQNKLSAGDAAPDFEAQTLSGDAISLSQLRQKRLVYLVFLRYAGCPICRMEIAALKRSSAELAAQGIETVLFLQSSRERLEASGAASLPFYVVPDKERAFYKRYGVGRGRLWDVVRAAGQAAKATLRGHLHGRFDGDELQLPAEFLVNRDGAISLAHYGRHVGDHLGPERIAEFVASIPDA